MINSIHNIIDSQQRLKCDADQLLDIDFLKLTDFQFLHFRNYYPKWLLRIISFLLKNNSTEVFDKVIIWFECYSRSWKPNENEKMDLSLLMEWFTITKRRLKIA